MSEQLFKMGKPSGKREQAPHGAENLGIVSKTRSTIFSGYSCLRFLKMSYAMCKIWSYCFSVIELTATSARHLLWNTSQTEVFASGPLVIMNFCESFKHVLHRS